ncbi:MAG: DUF881 domain-containing protein [Chloroflexi bacterium]|nr:DUF881 domain-containing protein [Chloroflexota bacterium]
MHALRSQIALTVVAFVLGLLVVAQLQSQQTAPALAGVSSQDLTILVANLNTRNDQLRTEIATLDRELGDLRADRSRGETSLDQLRDDLLDVRAFAGQEPVAGPGVSVTVAGPIGAPAVAELINELRNAGAEAMAIEGVRIVPGSVVAGAPGGLSLESTPLSDPFEIRAIGSPEALTGSLTRIGGIVAQLGAAEELATVTVTPVERMVVPASERNLLPRYGKPSL